jgi:hypothetical protein
VRTFGQKATLAAALLQIERDCQRCSFCQRPAEIVFVPLSPNGRTSRLFKLAQPVCLDRQCPGPSRSTPRHVPTIDARHRMLAANSELWREKPERARTYADIMLAFIASETNAGERRAREQYNGGDADGGRWNWVSVQVWQTWTAARIVRWSLQQENKSENFR